MSSTSLATAAAHRFIDFVNQTGSPYHSVAAVKKLLKQASFQELSENGPFPWSLQPGGKYFLTKHGSSVCAFVIGEKFQQSLNVQRSSVNGGLPAKGGGGFVILGAHTDSPCLRLRPNSKMNGTTSTTASPGTAIQVGVQTYGGGLWHTWFDRPLGLAGKAVVRDGENAMREALVHIPEPILIIPNLAIHLTTAEERKGFAVNAETQLQPVMMVTPLGESKDKEVICEPTEEAKRQKKDPLGLGNLSHDPMLLELIAEAINKGSKSAAVSAKDIVDLDLCLLDAEPSRLIGPNQDFIYSGRIDNLVSVSAQFHAIRDYANNTEAVKKSCDVAVACAFDHEEVGSSSSVGADSSNLEGWLREILCQANNNTLNSSISNSLWLQTISRSVFFSIDGAHALHPNYAAKHQAEHRPKMHAGLVIKTNANQRYATTPLTAALFRKVCEKAGSVPVQDFVVRNDSPCGSTIGPTVSNNLGMRSIDIGIGQWAMHSIKETCSTVDIEYLERFCRGAFEKFRESDDECKTV